MNTNSIRCRHSFDGQVFFRVAFATHAFDGRRLLRISQLYASVYASSVLEIFDPTAAPLVAALDLFWQLFDIYHISLSLSLAVSFSLLYGEAQQLFSLSLFHGVGG